MKTYNRAIVIRMQDGNDYVHQYPLIEYETITDAIRDQGENFVFEFFTRAYNARQRELSMYDAKNEIKRLVQSK